MNNRLFVGLLAASCLLSPSMVNAELRSVDLKTIGMDWATCAHAVRVAVQKQPGVASVKVSLERAMTEIRLNEKNAVTLTLLRQILKNGGFNAGAAEIEAIGTIGLKDNVPILTVLGTREEFRLIEDAAQPAAIVEARRTGTQTTTVVVVVVGTVDREHELRVRSVRSQ